MKLHTNHANIERGGVHAESTFTIKTNALSFSILSSGLYTDPEMAVVRELSCNAYDAHVAAKNTNTPFEIHLPNNLEPFLSIKDFGIGLSDSDIQGELIPSTYTDETGQTVQALDVDGNPHSTRSGGLYTTYFDSTKTTSNDYIGALGLGSKSPFSYTDAFEVISRHGGMKRTYAIFLNEEGIPSVALMGSIPTDGHTGLEVKISIKSSDFYKFKQKTATALKYFPVKPIIKGALGFEFDKLPTHKIETDTWTLSAAGRYDTSTLIAVQGNVAYRVDIAQFREEISSDLYKFIERSHVVAYFSIGELEVSANREEIRYDKSSVKAITERLVSIRAEFTKEVEQKIGKINKKYWSACIELNELSRELFSREEAIRNYVDIDKIKNKNLKTYVNNEGRIILSKYYGYELQRYSLSGYSLSGHKLKRSSVGYILEPGAATLVVINDVKRGGPARLKQYIIDNNYNDAIVITEQAEPMVLLDNITHQPIAYEGYEKELIRLKHDFGDTDIYKMSEITKSLEKKQGLVGLSFYRYSGLSSNRRGYYDKISWNMIDCDISNGGLYLPLKYATTPCYVSDGGDLPPITIDRAADIVESIKFLTREYNMKNGTEYTINDIVAMPVAAFNKVKKLDNWVNIFDFAKEILPEFAQELSFHKRYKNTSVALGAKDAISFSGFVSGIEQLSNDSIFKKTMLPLITAKSKNIVPKVSNPPIALIAQLFHVLHMDSSIDDTAFYDEDAFKSYPMLDMIENLSYNSKWSVLFDYINTVDRS